MVSSVTWQDDRRQMRECGVDAFLTKPIKQSELLERLLRLCDGAPDAEAANGNGGGEVDTGPLGLKILLAEDNPVNTAVAEQYLQELGCSVHVCTTGVEAVASFERSSFDAVLMDCHMPAMDGFAATRRIREIEETRGSVRTPIIAVSASAFESDRQRCEASGMDDFIAKPFEMAELRSVLLTCCNGLSLDVRDTGGPAPDSKDPFESLPLA